MVKSQHPTDEDMIMESAHTEGIFIVEIRERGKKQVQTMNH